MATWLRSRASRCRSAMAAVATYRSEGEVPVDMLLNYFRASGSPVGGSSAAD
jgi:hypothetical protein